MSQTISHNADFEVCCCYCVWINCEVLILAGLNQRAVVMVLKTVRGSLRLRGSVRERGQGRRKQSATDMPGLRNL